MNPFLHSTVARPASLRRGLRAMGLAALLVVSPALHAVDVNVATPDQLLSIRGIGPKTAQTIVQERARGGRYQSIQDLSERVKGIGPKKSAALQAAGLTVGSGAPAPGAGAAPPRAGQTAVDAQPVRRTR